MRIRICVHVVLLSLGLAIAGEGMAAAPPISDPAMRAPVGAMPGIFPTKVVAANVNAAPIAGSTLGGSGSDNILVSLPAPNDASAVRWTESRHNEGDIALLIGPFDPNDPSYYPPTTHFNNYNPLEGGQPFANTTLAWRVNQRTGALLASVRHNGVNNGDIFAGTAVGTTHGVVYFNQTASQGWGYRMNDGVFNNGQEGSSELQMGVAGYDQEAGEATFNTAVAYFPYEQGWVGAWVNGGGDGAATFASGAPGLDASAVTWAGGIATVTLPEVNSETDGMLFVAPTHDGNKTNIAAAFPTGGGWNVTLREDEQITPTITLGSTDNQFQFLYVPYSAPGLIGGRIQGTTGTALQSAGDEFFDVTRTSDGQYAISVYDSDGTTKLNENDGMLIMSVAGSLAGDPVLADKTFLSYHYDLATGNFFLQSRETFEANSPNSENQFGDWLKLRDSDFYFAWVDFADALAPAPSVPGDFDGDLDVDAVDLGIWAESFAVDGDGDADDDGDSDGDDFLVWQRNLGTVPEAVAATGAIPEPASIVLMLLGAVAMAVAAKRVG